MTSLAHSETTTRRWVLGFATGALLSSFLLGALFHDAARNCSVDRSSSLIWIIYTAISLAAVIIGWVIRRRRHNRQGQRLGVYDLEELIGRGGMGEVWRARQLQLDRPVAIKLIRSDVIATRDAEATTRSACLFAREARAMAGLSSPHTVAVHDCGVGEGDTLYYVMELLEGMDLHRLVKRHGPQSAARVVHYLRQACHSLAEAHGQGMVHRDIKPANLVACRCGLEADHLKVLDFGLAKFTRQNARADELLSLETITSGTPAFMAPEVIMGQQNVDARADIYALGCVAYWLLTGELLFDAHSTTELLVRQVQEEPRRPSQLTELPIPAELERIVMSCLEKDPDCRPQSAGDLIRRLKDLDLDDQWTAAQAKEWWELHGMA
jgi:serine/threonine-protein kinase